MRTFTNEDMSQPLTAELCREWLVARVFRFRPQDYRDKYPIWPGMVGLEVEMLPFVRGTKKVLHLQGKDSSAAILVEGMPAAWKPEFIENKPEKGLLRVALDDGDQVTFEPGGQIEFSSRPYPCLSEALQRMDDVQKKLTEILAAKEIVLSQTGIHPWQTVEEIGLQMTKSRYRAMNEYFGKIGPFGARMMRQTCTIQVNLDFGSQESTLAKRYLVGNLLAPFVTAMFANSPFVDGKRSDFKSFRGHIWQGLDATRTGFPKLKDIADKLTLESCVTAYFNYLMAAKVVFVEEAGYQVPAGNFTLADWIKNPVFGCSPRIRDLETHLSLLFPEVRPRGFLELRSVDCAPRHWQEIPALLYTAILYDDRCLDQTLELLLPYLPEMESLLSQCVYGLAHPTLQRVTEKLCDLSSEGLKRLPACFRGPSCLEKWERFVDRFPRRHRSPADDLVDFLAQGLGIDAFEKSEQLWLG